MPGFGVKHEAADHAGLVERVAQRVVRQIDALVFLLLVAVLQRLE